MSDLISTQESVAKIVDAAIRRILSGEQKLTKEYEQSVKDTVNVILNTSRKTDGDLIERQDSMNVVKRFLGDSEKSRTMQTALHILPSAQPKEVIPHRNYKYLSDYWCECGWHLGKKGEVKYCSECGRKVNWDG